jgi:uncharacterized protein (TIGR02996 family)
VTSDAELFELMRAAPDEAPRLVYADWLLERSDPRGELIVLEHRDRAGLLVEGGEIEWLLVLAAKRRVAPRLLPRLPMPAEIPVPPQELTPVGLHPRTRGWPTGQR